MWKTTYPSKFQQLRGYIKKAIEEGLFPGCAIGLWHKDQGPFPLTFGRLTYAPWSPTVSEDTVFDLASLTKPLVTALLCAHLVSKGHLSLDERLCELSSVLGRIPEDKKAITIAQLLSHSSGLPAYLPIYRALHFDGKRPLPKDAVTGLILDTPLEYAPGTLSIYSDLGFILLGHIVESLIGSSLDRGFKEIIAPSFGLDSRKIGFRPCDMGSHSIAPSQFCPLRKRVLFGEVNDLNAWAMGGVAGHAGLFGPITHCLTLISRLWEAVTGLRTLHGIERSVLKKFIFYKNPISGSGWRLGFDTPSTPLSQAGSGFSHDTIGHLGYTGTSFWLDIQEGKAVVLLTNRQFPFDSPHSREHIKIFRRKVHDLVIW